MSEEFATQQNAIAATVDSAPTSIETPEVSSGDTAANAESAPAEGVETQLKTPQPGSEPENEKMLRELKSQRKKRQELERQNAYLQGLIDAKGAAVPAKPDAPKEVVEPKLDNYATYEEFDAANRQYIVALAKQELRQELQREKEKEQVETQQQSFEKRMALAIAKDPTIQDIIQDRTMPVNAAMATVIKSSEAAPELLKWLDGNREEAKRIAGIRDPIISARELALVEGQLRAAPPSPPPKRVSQAPEPIATVNSGAGSLTVEDDKLPMDQWAERERQRVKALGRRQ